MDLHAHHSGHNHAHKSAPRDAADWAAALRAAGLRVTGQRLAALDWLQHHPHADAEAIFRGVKAQLPAISLQAVHGIVTDLAARGILARIDLPDSASARYETRTGDNHHHIQCIACGRIEDVDCVIGHAPCLHPADAHGMRLLEASVTFRAICQECEEKGDSHDR